MKKVLVGGAFDLFHYGHLCMLKWAKSLGDYLVVHVSADRRIKFKKGNNRPIFPEKERIAILKAIKYVDEIHVTRTPFKKNPILKAIGDTKPDIYARNKTANPQTLKAEQELCKKLGIKIIYYTDFPHKQNRLHTTDIVHRINSDGCKKGQSLKGTKKNEVLKNIFRMQQLVLNKKDQKKIQNATIAVAGIGGIGSFIVEFLVRNGISHFKIADLDPYEPTNARQPFMTQKNIGQPKARVAKERVLAINPHAKVKLYETGITPNNYLDFCTKVDVICAQTDEITSQLLLYMGAARLKTTLLHAGRSKWPNRHLVSVSTYDYRKKDGEFSLRKLGINPSEWGVDNITLLKKFVSRVDQRKNCSKLIEKIQTQNKKFRQRSFLKVLKNGKKSDLDGISDKSKEYLLQIAKRFPNKFYEMAITPELCSVSAALVTTAVKNIILGRPLKKLAIDLYHGKVYETDKKL